MNCPTVNIRYVAEVDSTMNTARGGLATANGTPFGIVAQAQTCGRGSGTRSWTSPVGNLYFSLCIPVHDAKYMQPELLPVLPLLCGLACRDAIEECVAPVQPAAQQHTVCTKWPNDVVYKAKKLGGMILECVDDYAILGIGINITTAPSLDGNGRTPTSVYDMAADCDTTVSVSPRILAESIWRHVFAYALDTELTRACVVAEFEQSMDKSLVLYKRVGCTRDPTPLTAVSLNEWGHLTVRDEQGNEEVLTSDYLV